MSFITGNLMLWSEYKSPKAYDLPTHKMFVGVVGY